MKTIFLLLLVSTTAMAQLQLPKFDIQGHRGCRGLKPENTIPAFIAALDSGVTTLEMDVAITKDKQIVVSHEPWMSADICLDAAGGTIPKKEEMRFNIYEMTYEQVKQFDCGSKVNERFPQQEKMVVSKPLLKDVIAAAETHIKSYTQYEVDYNIEIKSMPEGDNKFHPEPAEFSDMVYVLLDRYLPMERVVIQSFDFRVLKYWHEKYPEMRLSALVDNKKTVSQNLTDLGFTPSVYSPDFKSLTPDAVKYLHAKKARVIPWTVNEPNDMLSMKGLGVDGIITDYPNRAMKYKITLGLSRKQQ